MLRNSSPSYAFAIVAAAAPSFFSDFSAPRSNVDVSAQTTSESLRIFFKASSYGYRYPPEDSIGGFVP